MGLVGGTLYIRRNGKLLRAAGEFTYNLGEPMLEPVIGPSGVNGHKSTQQAAKLEGSITVTDDLDVRELVTGGPDEVIVQLAGGMTYALHEAMFSGSGDVTTDEGKMAVAWTGPRADLF